MAWLIGIIVLSVYAGTGVKFWTGFNRTNFSQNKFFLTMMWPIFIFNPSYRLNFVKALKG